jgi:hypothetical protein
MPFDTIDGPAPRAAGLRRPLQSHLARCPARLPHPEPSPRRATRPCSMPTGQLILGCLNSAVRCLKNRPHYTLHGFGKRGMPTHYYPPRLSGSGTSLLALRVSAKSVAWPPSAVPCCSSNGVPTGGSGSPIGTSGCRVTAASGSPVSTCLGGSSAGIDASTCNAFTAPNVGAGAALHHSKVFAVLHSAPRRHIAAEIVVFRAWFKMCHFQVTPEIDRALIVKGFLVLGVTLT